MREKLRDVPSEFGKRVFANIEAGDALAKLAKLRHQVKEARDRDKAWVNFEGYRWSIAATM